MQRDKDAPEGDHFHGTSVDLGEDLLEGTRSSAPSPAKAKPASEEPSEEDELQRAQILLNEGLLEDAKKVFRRILRAQPGHSIARERLDEIQKREIQDLLAGEGPRKRFGPAEGSAEDSPRLVLDKLEKDLHLGLERAEPRPVPDLFADEKAYSRYRERALAAALSLSPRDRIDFGVAYLEMGLFEVAQAIFEEVAREDKHKTVGMYLLGIALIHGGKAIEATIRLEPVARDLTLSESQKADFLYLMGLAFDRLADGRKAREFFRRVSLLNPKYRDVLERLK